MDTDLVIEYADPVKVATQPGAGLRTATCLSSTTRSPAGDARRPQLSQRSITTGIAMARPWPL